MWTGVACGLCKVEEEDDIEDVQDAVAASCQTLIL